MDPPAPKGPSEIVINNYSSKEIKDLALLGKVWGFLKYYHPEVTSGKYEWDNELLAIMPEILKASSATERNKLLSDWITSLGVLEKADEYVIPFNDDEIKYLPDLDWIENQTELGSDLSALLITARNAYKQRTSNKYVELASGIENPVFVNENFYWNMSYENDGLKLLALFRYWNMIEYFFPSKFLADEDWDDVLESMIPDFIDAKNVLNYKLACLKLIGKIQDSHAYIPDATIDTYFGVNYPTVKIRFIEGQPVVTALGDGPNHKVMIGDIIKKVNGIDVSEWIARNKDYIPASNEAARLRDMAGLLLRSNSTSVSVDIERNGNILRETITCYPYQIQYQPIPSHKWLSEDIGYIYCASINNNLSEIMTTFSNTKGLVIDLRCYPSEFIVFTLGSYFVQNITDFAKFTKGNITYPGLFTFTPNVSLEGNGNLYKGKVVVLVNEETKSQPEYTTMAFRSAPNTTVIGSTTAGADGNVSLITLPGNFKSYISGLGVYYPDGGQTQRIGIIPDIEIRPTIQGIKERRDEVLEKAIKIIHAN
ncbi:MAG: S41 family peptidase [Tannerellaceae bacterium]|nr:S41 family peptidase [Tannerellaceae bacterium]